MPISFQTFDFSPILGWSISRYEVFDKCKRQYFYAYYSKFAAGVPQYKVQQLRGLTSFPLEIGNVVHDVLEAFLRRLQKSDSNIDEARFFNFAREKSREYFTSKTFIETYYGTLRAPSFDEAFEKISKCLDNFLKGPCYSWIFMKAMTNKDNWLIEPPGFGETRLNGLKAYCKMDFLFPVGDEFHILDWKTGGKDRYKHSNQLIGYAAAAHNNFNAPWKNIFPKIVYLYPEFDEFELDLKEDVSVFFEKVKTQTEEMYGFCDDVNRNVPLPIEAFALSPSKSNCVYCNFQELCFSKNGFPAARETVF
jgi:hypothetical protein